MISKHEWKKLQQKKIDKLCARKKSLEDAHRFLDMSLHELISNKRLYRKVNEVITIIEDEVYDLNEIIKGEEELTMEEDHANYLEDQKD